MKRRNFIYLTSAGLVSLTIPTWYYKYSNVEFDPSLAKPELLSTLWDVEKINGIGKNYSNLFPEECNIQNLVELLSEDHPSEPANITQLLSQKIINDYKEGKTVMVDGWILSQTEARQCALFSLKEFK